MTHRRVICVSNRVLPPRRNAAAGGLAVGVLAALKHSGGVWFGWNGELDAAIIVNPHDARAVGHAIQSALTMSLAERRDRHQRLLAMLRAHDIASWSERFVTALRAVDHAADRAA